MPRAEFQKNHRSLGPLLAPSRASRARHQTAALRSEKPLEAHPLPLSGSQPLSSEQAAGGSSHQNRRLAVRPLTSRASQSRMTNEPKGPPVLARCHHSAPAMKNRTATTEVEQAPAPKAPLRSRTGLREQERALLSAAHAPQVVAAWVSSAVQTVTASQSRTASKSKAAARESVQEAPRAVNQALWRLQLRARRLRGASHLAAMVRRTRPRMQRTGQHRAARCSMLDPMTVAVAAMGRASRRSSLAGTTAMGAAQQPQKEPEVPPRQVAPCRESP